MKNEGVPDRSEVAENAEQVLEREIKKVLSPTWAKTIQELLPGYLPNKSTSELTGEELELYRKAYHVVGEMVKKDEVEAIFEERHVLPPSDPALEREVIARPKFKLKTHGGKRSRNNSDAWQGSLATDLGL